MKKRIISMFIAVVMVFTAIPQEAVTAAANTPNDPGVDLLLAPFNVLNGDSLYRHNLGASIFVSGGQESFEQLGLRTHRESSSTEFRYSESRDMSSFEEEMYRARSSQVNSRVGLGFLFRARMNRNAASASHVSHSRSYESFYSGLQVQRAIGSNSVTPNGINRNRDAIWGMLHPDFKHLLLNGTFGDLAAQYGTHLISSYVYGGYAEFTQSIVQIDATESRSIEEAIGLSVSASGSYKSFSASGAYRNSQVTRAISDSVESNFVSSQNGFVHGGTQGAASLVMGDWNENTLHDWFNSIVPSNSIGSTAIIPDDNLTLIGVWGLLPDEYASRRRELEQLFLIEAGKIDDEFLREYVYSNVRPSAFGPTETVSVPEFDFEPTRTLSSPSEFSEAQVTLAVAQGGHILVDASAFSESVFNGTTIRVPSLASTVRFIGGGQNFTGLNIEVLGNTTVIFDNFSYTGGENAPALRFSGANPTLVSIGLENSISGSGHFNAIHASGNLSIFGDADLKVEHLTPSTATVSAVTPLSASIEQYRQIVATPAFNGTGSGGYSTFRYEDIINSAYLNGRDVNDLTSRISTINNSTMHSKSLIRVGGITANPSTANSDIEDNSLLTMYRIPYETEKAPTHIRWNGRGERAATMVLLHTNSGWQPLGRIYATAGNHSYEWALSESQRNGITGGDIIIAFFSFRDEGRVGIHNSSTTPFTFVTVSNSGRDAINVSSILSVNMDATLTAIGSDGLRGVDGSNGVNGANHGSGNDKAPPGPTVNGYGGHGDFGTNGTTGGRGGNAVSANVVNITGNTEAHFIGGSGNHGGNGGDGGNGGKGRNGTAVPARGGSAGGFAGGGGHGGNGGIGGSALTIPHSINFRLADSCSIMFVSGSGGNGGNGGAGGKGGAGGNSWGAYSAGRARDGGRGGNAGSGGNNGTLISEIPNALLSMPYISDVGDSGNGGTRGSSGNTSGVVAGVQGETGVQGTLSDIMLERDSQLSTSYVSELVVTNNAQNLGFEQNGLFDISTLSIEVKTGNQTKRIESRDVNIFYDFSEIGETVITVSYLSPETGRIVAEIPVTVVEPTLSDIVQNAPVITTFSLDESFPFAEENFGLSWELMYSNGFMAIVRDNFDISPTDFTATAGTQMLTVTHSEFPNVTRTFNVFVGLCEVCDEDPCACLIDESCEICGEDPCVCSGEPDFSDEPDVPSVICDSCNDEGCCLCSDSVCEYTRAPRCMRERCIHCDEYFVCGDCERCSTCEICDEYPCECSDTNEPCEICNDEGCCACDSSEPHNFRNNPRCSRDTCRDCDEMFICYDCPVCSSCNDCGEYPCICPDPCEVCNDEGCCVCDSSKPHYYGRHDARCSDTCRDCGEVFFCGEDDCEICGEGVAPCEVCGEDPCVCVVEECDCRNCEECGFIGGRYGFGRVTNSDSSDKPTIADALSILRFLVNLSSPINDDDNARAAANITTPGNGDPKMADALAVLRYLVRLSSPLDEIWR